MKKKAFSLVVEIIRNYTKLAEVHGIARDFKFGLENSFLKLNYVRTNTC